MGGWGCACAAGRLGVRLRARDWVAIVTVVVSLCVLGLTAGHVGADTTGTAAVPS